MAMGRITSCWFSNEVKYLLIAIALAVLVAYRSIMMPAPYQPFVDWRTQMDGVVRRLRLELSSCIVNRVLRRIKRYFKKRGIEGRALPDRVVTNEERVLHCNLEPESNSLYIGHPYWEDTNRMTAIVFSRVWQYAFPDCRHRFQIVKPEWYQAFVFYLSHKFLHHTGLSENDLMNALGSASFEVQKNRDSIAELDQNRQLMPYVNELSKLNGEDPSLDKDIIKIIEMMEDHFKEGPKNFDCKLSRGGFTIVRVKPRGIRFEQTLPKNYIRDRYVGTVDTAVEKGSTTVYLICSGDPNVQKLMDRIVNRVRQKYHDVVVFENPVSDRKYSYVVRLNFDIIKN